ncbi:hypothetical protein DYB26_016484 [Aphanomyces astaci]|uniref:Uncharacterized protein n=1 Tax=Aphanomyces astaci TaxID=112090 RepID=A0A397ENQ3_APHAT|nr:hypothetical protein DYB31_016514 [Aphanomyces astaci]RHZ42894.1 hypothetical protein DYB26_016484 [Aphanomyces astaci]
MAGGTTIGATAVSKTVTKATAALIVGIFMVRLALLLVSPQDVWTVSVPIPHSKLLVEKAFLPFMRTYATVKVTPVTHLYLCR